MEARVVGICPQCGGEVLITDGINFRCASPECSFDSQTVSENWKENSDEN